MREKTCSKVQSGFSLVELSIVLVVIGLLLGGVIGSTVALIQSAQSRQADKDLELIRESLIGFLVENGRLPCADTDGDGIENGPTPCSNWGIVPFAQLGVPRSDPWGGDYRYRVDIRFADEPFPASTPLSSFTLTDPPPGNGINVRDSAAGGNTVATDMAVIIISEGANRGSGSVDENENTDNDDNFVQRTYSRAAGSEFDDRLLWISPMILRAKMLEAGRLP
jgi:prepilin-type N-terminal cleavage/methylation domain-containing protein